MPSLGADMAEGTLLEWRVKPGDTVRKGDIVAVVDTSKAEIEVETFQAGTVAELLVSEGTRVPVGTALAVIEPLMTGAPVAGAPTPAAGAPTSPAGAPTPAPGAPTPTPSAPTPAPSAPTPAAGPQTAAAGPPTPPPSLPVPPTPPHPLGEPAGDRRVRISPIARRAAQALGVDISTVRGTGPAGAITRTDVERVREPSRPAAPAPTPEKQAAMRQAIGALMARSKREIPHYYLQIDVDMSGALHWLSEHNLERAPQARVLPAAMLLAAVARAARDLPQMNGFWIDGSFQAAEAVHLGVAVSLRGGGLVAPALHDADRKSLDELMGDLRELVRRARAGVLRSSEMSDPTITVTNLGEQGADLVHGVIYPPQVALVGFGAVRQRPWAQGGMVGARPTVIATLAVDHRAADGHAGSRFLAAIRRRLEQPRMLDDSSVPTPTHEPQQGKEPA